MKWYDIAPADAAAIDCRQRPDLDPPLADDGTVCPWPWEPQQLTDAPMGMYHCGYCGSMVLAGQRHPDYREDEMR